MRGLVLAENYTEEVCSKKMPLANGVVMTFALLLANKANRNRIKRRDEILMKFIFGIDERRLCAVNPHAK